MTNIRNIGLFKVQLIEEKLWNILQRLDQDNNNISQYCEDWWEVSQEATSALAISQYFGDEKQREMLAHSSLLECCAVSIAYIVSIHSEEPPYILYTLMKNIFL